MANPLLKLADFKAEYKLNKALQRITNCMAGTLQANGQPMFPNEPGTLLNDIIRDYNLQPAEAPPPYDFGLDNHVTIEAIKAECTRRNVSFFDVTNSHGNRQFYDITYGAEPQPGQEPDLNPWREYSRPETADKNLELAQVVCHGDSTTIVDWTTTMEELRKLFLARVYTNDMAKCCLMHLVQKYHPEQRILLRTMTANQIATYLLQLDSNRDKRTLHRQQLFRIMRSPEEDLSAALARVQLSIDAIYPANDPAYAVHRSNTLRAAILSFCSDPVAQAVMELIRSRQSECLPLTDEEVREYAIKFEEYTHCKPVESLAFGRKVNNMPVATFIQLNSSEVTANTIYPAYPAYPSGFDNPYPAYQTFEQVRHPNVGHRLQQQLAQQQQEALVPLQPNPQQAPVLAPPVPAMLPFGNPPVLPAYAAQQPDQQRRRVDPRLLEEAAARQQALAEGKLTPQKTVINPDANWLQGLPPIMPDMGVSGSNQNPRTSPEATPVPSSARKETAGMPMHATGDQSLWDLHDLPAPTRTMDFYELPTDTPIVVQNQQRLAKVGNEIVRVKNHPEDHIPTVMERFEALAMQQQKESGAKSKKLSKDRSAEERSITPRRSSRNKKPTEIYQAGLNSMQTTSNPRGYVDSSGRYRSYSRDRFPRDQSRQRSPSRQDRYKRSPSRQDRYQRQPSRDSYPRQDRYSRQPSRDASSRQDRYQRQPSRDSNYRQDRYPRQPSRDANYRQDRYPRQPSRDQSRSGYYQRTPSRGQSASRFRTPSGDRSGQRSNYRPQSKSPGRPRTPGHNSDTRQSRAPYRTDRSDRSSSMSTRNTYTLMKRGVNCKPSYDPAKMKYCTKCMNNDHHEFECARYYSYSEDKCSFCHKMYHLSQECKEIKEFPPGVSSKN
jgi:hypothetical protein